MLTCKRAQTTALHWPLSARQKRHFLALEAENNQPYPPLPDAARQALDDGVICDMLEDHAPDKPRYVLRATCYVLPDYARFLATARRGWRWRQRKTSTMPSPC